MNGKTRWNRSTYGDMTESVIRSIHGAPARARVTTYRNDPGDRVEGKSRPCTVYVMSGSMELESAGQIATLSQNDVFSFDGGAFELRINRFTPVVSVWAWELPEEVQADDGATEAPS